MRWCKQTPEIEWNWLAWVCDKESRKRVCNNQYHEVIDGPRVWQNRKHTMKINDNDCMRPHWAWRMDTGKKFSNNLVQEKKCTRQNTQLLRDLQNVHDKAKWNFFSSQKKTRMKIYLSVFYREKWLFCEAVSVRLWHVEARMYMMHYGIVHIFPPPLIFDYKMEEKSGFCTKECLFSRLPFRLSKKWNVILIRWWHPRKRK